MKAIPVKERRTEAAGIYKSFNLSRSRAKTEARTEPGCRTYRASFQFAAIQEDTLDCMKIAGKSKSFDFWK